MDAETAALIANATAKKANAAATANSYSAYKSGQIYGVAGDSKKLGRETAVGVANAYSVVAQRQMATAGATTRLAGAVVIQRTATTAASAAIAKKTLALRAGAAALRVATVAGRGLLGVLRVLGLTNPWGWAIAGLTILPSLYAWMNKTKDASKSYSKSYNDFIGQARSDRGPKEDSEPKEQTVSTDLRMLDTLKDFSGKKLNKSDFEYSVQIIEKLQKKYGNLGISIDRVGRSFSMSAQSQERFEKAAGKKIADQKREELADFEKALQAKEQEFAQEENIHLTSWFSTADQKKLKLLKGDIVDTKRKTVNSKTKSNPPTRVILPSFLARMQCVAYEIRLRFTKRWIETKTTPVSQPNRAKQSR